MHFFIKGGFGRLTEIFIDIFNCTLCVGVCGCVCLNCSTLNGQDKIYHSIFTPWNEISHSDNYSIFLEWHYRGNWAIELLRKAIL